MEKKLLELIEIVYKRRKNLIQLLAYKDKAEESLTELESILKDDVTIKKLYENNTNLYDNEKLKKDYADYSEKIEVMRTNYQKYCNLVKDEPLATKQYLGYFTELLLKLLETVEYIKELRNIENDYSYKGDLVQVTDAFGNKRLINPDKAIKYYTIILKIRENFAKIKPLYTSLFYNQNDNTIQYPGAIKDESIYFKNTNEINPYMLLEQYEKNLMELMNLKYTDTELNYNNMCFKVSESTKKQILFNLKQITNIVNDYGIDISPSLKKYLENKCTNNNEIIFSKTYNIEPELNINIQETPDEKNDSNIEEYINNVKDIFKKPGKKRIIKYRGNSFQVSSAYSGKLLDNLMKINRIVINENIQVDSEFIEFLQNKAINKNAIITFGERKKEQNQTNNGENTQEEKNNIIKIENVRKPKNPKVIKRVLKVACALITSSVMLLTSSLVTGKTIIKNNLNKTYNNQYNYSEQVPNNLNDESISYIEESGFSFDDRISIKENAEIYSNMYDTQNKTNGMTPSFEGNLERIIEAVVINYNNELIYVSRNEEISNQKVDYYLSNGGKIEGVLCRILKDSNFYEGFYNYNDIITKTTTKGVR